MKNLATTFRCLGPRLPALIFGALWLGSCSLMGLTDGIEQQACEIGGCTDLNELYPLGACERWYCIGADPATETSGLCEPSLLDDDRDGVSPAECALAGGSIDCDDGNPDRHPATELDPSWGEICDGQDNDCDDLIDEELSFDLSAAVTPVPGLEALAFGHGGISGPSFAANLDSKVVSAPLNQANPEGLSALDLGAFGARRDRRFIAVGSGGRPLIPFVALGGTFTSGLDPYPSVILAGAFPDGSAGVAHLDVSNAARPSDSFGPMALVPIGSLISITHSTTDEFDSACDGSASPIVSRLVQYSIDNNLPLHAEVAEFPQMIAGLGGPVALAPGGAPNIGLVAYPTEAGVQIYRISVQALVPVLELMHTEPDCGPGCGHVSLVQSSAPVEAGQSTSLALAYRAGPCAGPGELRVRRLTASASGEITPAGDTQVVAEGEFSNLQVALRLGEPELVLSWSLENERRRSRFLQRFSSTGPFGERLEALEDATDTPYPMALDYQDLPGAEGDIRLTTVRTVSDMLSVSSVTLSCQ